MAHPCLRRLVRNGICRLELRQYACRKATYADTLIAPRVQLVEKHLQGSNVYAIAVNSVYQPFPDFETWATMRKIDAQKIFSVRGLPSHPSTSTNVSLLSAAMVAASHLQRPNTTPLSLTVAMEKTQAEAL